MKRTYLIILIVAMTITGLASCGKVRELPSGMGSGKVITLFNSNLEQTSKMDMLDTLYVQVAGLKSDSMHTIEVLDPDGNMITKMTLMSDADGLISPSALWYDVGMRKSDSKPDIGGALSLKAFFVHVVGPGTDYMEPFYIVYSQNNVGQQPRPVIWATSNSTGAGIEHAFDETGTTDASGIAGKTKIYVQGNHIPASIAGFSISDVDIYIVPSKGAGNLWTSGETLTDKFVVRKLGVPVIDDGATGSKMFDPALVWDLDNPAAPLINPGENNNSHDIIVDVNKNGVFDLGDDVNSDGKIDRFIDGIGGQGNAGFIVRNTPANDFFVTLTDQFGNKTNSVFESNSALNVSMDNIPFGASPVLHLFEHLTIVDAITPINLSVSPADPANKHYLPFVTSSVFVNTVDTINPQYPASIPNGSTQLYDLVITGVGSTPYSASIKVFHAPATIKTSNGTAFTSFFDETGTVGGSTSVYVQTAGLALSGSPTVYVLPNRTSGWTSDTIISGFITSKKYSVGLSGNFDTDKLIWDLNAGPFVKNPQAPNDIYDIIIDANNDGVYTSGTDYVLSPGFVVRDTVNNDLPDLLYANIASGGKFTYDYSIGSYDYDYRDNFSVSGAETLSSYYVGRGIKAIWNPYINYWSTTPQTTTTPSLYYGTYVDVYIVDAVKVKPKLTKGNLNSIVLGQAEFADVAGGKKTIPVQGSCQNGAGQQNIWIPNFTAGKYYVIVDVNTNGILDEGIDIIDAVTKDGKTIKDDNNTVGFTVN